MSMSACVQVRESKDGLTTLFWHRANELAEYLRSKGCSVSLHNNESLGIDRNEAYKDSQVGAAVERRPHKR